mgnify:CR=1 FL=1|jgi:hypothetical protein
MTILINNLERNLPDNGVTIVHYSIVLEQDGISKRNNGTISFTPDPEAEGYIPFDELTEAQVIGWVEVELDVPAIEASLQARIDEEVTPTTASGMPWSVE